MPSGEACFEEDLRGQFERYRADRKRQFCKSCLTYLVALVFLLALSAFAVWALLGIAFWTLMLLVEATAAFGSSPSLESEEFSRWRRREAWVAARNGDPCSLHRLQNVQ